MAVIRDAGVLNEMHGDLPRQELIVAGARRARLDRRISRASASGIRCCRRCGPARSARRCRRRRRSDAESLETILADFESKIIPGITHWNHPAFFGYFATSSSVPGILAELLAATLDVKAMLWKTSPAATELEQVVTDWLRQMLGMRDGWFGITTDTASISSMLALAAAREARPELQIRERGMAGRTDLPRLRVYCSSHAHSSIDKAALALGIGLENVVKIDDDDDFRMRPDALDAAIVADRANGFLPLACVATVGTTSMSSIDPVPAIADDLSARGRLAARRRRVRRRARHRAGVSRHPRRRRGRGLARREPAQVAVHAVRLLGVLRQAAGRAQARLLARAGISRDARAGRSRELHGLRRAARPPVSRAQAVDGHPRVRRRRARRRDCASTARSRESSPTGSSRAATGSSSRPFPSRSSASATRRKE